MAFLNIVLAAVFVVISIDALRAGPGRKK